MDNEGVIMNNKEMSILDSICKWRSELMGIAIIWVAVFHSYLVFEEPWMLIKNTGYAGVDIFLLLSGVGMYYSLRKSDDVGFFLKKRAERIMPSYLPFIILWCIWMLKDAALHPVDVIKIVSGNIFMTGWINSVPNQFNWYVQIICWLYVLSPILYQLIIRTKNYLQKGLIFLAGFGVSLPFLFDVEHLMGASRVPIFILGMLWAHENCSKKAREVSVSKRWINRIGVILLALAGVLLFVYYYYRDVNILWLYGLWWYPFLLITPGLCYGLSVIMNMMEKAKLKWLLVPIKYIGLASFEIYLLHIDICKYVIQNMTGVSNWYWVGIIVLFILLGIAYHYCVEMIMRAIKHIKK